VFCVLSGRWRFFWGNTGDDGEVVLNEGDVINIPTGIFRGFQNIGTDYGMIMAILGGDDAGGGVVWAPQVIEEAQAHGLILGNNGVLYDSKKGEALPKGVEPMPTLDDDQMALFSKVSTKEFVPRFVARYWDMMALADRQPAVVIDKDGMLKDRPGFSLELIRESSLKKPKYKTDRYEVLMVMKGHWKLAWGGDETTLAPGDVCALPPGSERSLTSAMNGQASLLRVRNTDDEAGPTMGFDTPAPSRR
jgi:mannose-6-phosphate isomerase-like protein (cupin superfamily)